MEEVVSTYSIGSFIESFIVNMIPATMGSIVAGLIGAVIAGFVVADNTKKPVRPDSEPTRPNLPQEFTLHPGRRTVSIFEIQQ